MTPRNHDPYLKNRWYCKLEKPTQKMREEVMWIAAVSAVLAPTCRNSQKGVKKLLVAVAADEEGP